MLRYAAGYAATLLAVVALDLLWLGVIARPLYQSAIGHLMAARPNLVAAGFFYLVFAGGVMVFVLLPHLDAPWAKTLLTAAMFGFFTYAVYDLTNLATLRDWPVGISLIDMCWGIVVSMAAASAGKFVLDRMS